MPSGLLYAPLRQRNQGLIIMRIKKLALVGLVLLAFSFVSHASVGFVVRNNQLVGAVGINVGGTLYDASFVDGSMASLGLNTASNPFLESKSLADLASQALLDQVLIGAFSVHPAYISGCNPQPLSGSVCSINTFYGGAQVSNGYTYLWSSYAVVLAFPDPKYPAIKGVGGIGIPVASFTPNGLDTTADSRQTFAVWSLASATPPYNSPVALIPEPETFAMMLAGLGMLSAVARRRESKLDSSPE